MTVVAPPTLPCASFFACSGVSLSFTADIIVSLETQRAKPPNSLSNTYSFILVSDSPAAALRSSPRCFDFGMAHCCCSRLPGRWLAQLFPRTRGRGNGSGGGDLTFAPSLKAPLHGVWSHFFWRAPNVFSRIWCLDGEHCCTHLIVSVHLKVTYGLQALVDAGRKLRLPLFMHVPHTGDELTRLALFESLVGLLCSSAGLFPGLTEWPNLGAPRLDVVLLQLFVDASSISSEHCKKLRRAARVVSQQGDCGGGDILGSVWQFPMPLAARTRCTAAPPSSSSSSAMKAEQATLWANHKNR